MAGKTGLASNSYQGDGEDGGLCLPDILLKEVSAYVVLVLRQRNIKKSGNVELYIAVSGGGGGDIFGYMVYRRPLESDEQNPSQQT